jgi:hypothetical protein
MKGEVTARFRAVSFYIDVVVIYNLKPHIHGNNSGNDCVNKLSSG